MRFLTVLSALAFANSNAASKLYVCPVPQNSDLSRSDYEALSWVEIKAVGKRGETGKNTNVLTYPTWDTKVVQKAKGMTDAGSPELEVARLPFDPGQKILREAGAVGNNNNYAFREVRADGTTATNGTVKYNRGLVSGPRSPGGANEDFDLEIFTLALQQEEIVVDPLSDGVAPVNTVAPTITGTAKVGTELSASNGTFTGDTPITYSYQWFVGGVAAAGETTNKFTPSAEHIGKIVSVRVTASNASGSAFGFSASTVAVVA